MCKVKHSVQTTFLYFCSERMNKQRICNLFYLAKSHFYHTSCKYIVFIFLLLEREFWQEEEFRSAFLEVHGLGSTFLFDSKEERGSPFPIYIRRCSVFWKQNANDLLLNGI